MQKENTTNLLESISPSAKLPEVRVSLKSEEFNQHEGSPLYAANMGTVMHSIMENCKKLDDIPKAIQSKIESGVITAEQGLEVDQKLQKVFENKKVTDWFDSKHKVLTEVDIILPNGGNKRPDRIVIQDKKAIVIDYKFGQEDDKDKHKKQVLEYIRLVEKMGFEETEGYIWYVMEEDVVEVK